MANRVIETTIVLEGNEKFVQGMDEVTDAMKRAAAAAEELTCALSKLSIYLGEN